MLKMLSIFVLIDKKMIKWMSKNLHKDKTKMKLVELMFLIRSMVVIFERSEQVWEKVLEVSKASC